MVLHGVPSALGCTTSRSTSYTRDQEPFAFSEVTRMALPLWAMRSMADPPNLSAALRTTQGKPAALRNSSIPSCFTSAQ